nr:hypothetical protein Iba_chr08eCG6680 [Ipomoea batatas]
MRGEVEASSANQNHGRRSQARRVPSATVLIPGEHNFIVNVPDEDYYAARQEDIVQARRRDRKRERRHMRGGLVRETEPDQVATAKPSRSGALYSDVGSS